MNLDSITTLDHPDGEPYFIPNETELDIAKGRVAALNRTGDKKALEASASLQKAIDEGVYKDALTVSVTTPYFEV